MISAGLVVYIFFWFSWWLWVQTIGRLPGGLGAIPTLGFDALFIGSVILYLRNKKEISRPQKIAFVAATFQEWSKPMPKDVTGMWKILIYLFLASVTFTVGFGVPFDWDGMDYHLPPLIESWQQGFWHRSENPYFAARNYPKTAGVLYLWWICHFGKWWGLISVLLMSTLHWQAGLLSSLKLFGKNKWVYLLWVAYPLAARQLASAYADLAGLSSLLVFLVLFFERKYLFAALALALHGSIKFTNLMSAGVAVAALGFWIIKIQSDQSHLRKQVKWLSIAVFTFFFVALVQPIENFFYEGKLFGPLQCTILGHDFCNGTLDPKTLVVYPTVEISAENPWILKVFEGWIPSQFIPGFDIPHGGFGWAWVIPVLFGTFFLFSVYKREGISTFKNMLKGFFQTPTGAVLFVVFLADFSIPALWYPRYHMGLGWALAMLSAMFLIYSDHKRALSQFKSRTELPVYAIVVIGLALQILWVVPQRTWFLGTQAEKTLEGRVERMWENLKSITFLGYPAHATNPADLKSISLYKRSNEDIAICGDSVRPSLPAYGALLTNRVHWIKPITTSEGKAFCPTGALE